MQSLDIGISGLNAAQEAISVIGNNVSNAATEGYHLQRVNLVPAYSSQIGSVLQGGGVDVTGVTRMIDVLLEQEILRQRSALGDVSQELATLKTIENAFGELSADGSLSETIDKFFSALQDLCTHPTEVIWQSQTIVAGQSLSDQFNTLGEFLYELENQILSEAENKVENINTLVTQIAELNASIERTEVSGAKANNLRDQRDQCIKDLSEFVSVQTQSREYGVVDVRVAGVPVVVGASTIELEVSVKEDNQIGISAAGANDYMTSLQGGELGGLLSLRNEILIGIHDDLDALARSIIQKINQYHVQGVGSQGSFTELTGWDMASEDLVDFSQDVTDGNIYIRVINSSTGEITRHEIDVDVSTDSLSTIAADISAITGLNASVFSSKLTIQAEGNYEFDFLPCVLPEPTATNLTATSPPAISVSGIYTGDENQTFTFTATGSGSVGNGDLRLEVTNGDGRIVSTLNVGAGYAASDKLDLGNGIKISLSTGDLNSGDTFEIDAFTSSDTSGTLAALGINTFFSGSSARDMAICSDIVDSPSRIATALGADQSDNTNALLFLGVKDEAVDSLNAMTPEEFYRQLVTNIGQQVSIKQTRSDSIQAMIQELTSRQSEISGVDINDEAAQLLIFERMFQAMSKYLSMVQESIETMMEML
jgi:flagellar hook-associated protein 1 FlgK